MKHTVTVYRPRIERVTVTVEAPSRYAAEERAFDVADQRSDWTLLDQRAGWYCGQSHYDNDPFIPEKPPRIFDGEGDSEEIAA
jgi:hypothetical protein